MFTFQLLWARIFSTLYTIVQMLVLIAIFKDMTRDWRSPTSIFFISVAGVFILAAILHPLEFTDVFCGIIYFFLIPSMYMLLQIYAFSKMNDISWGVRENPVKKKPKTTKDSLQVCFFNFILLIKI